MDSQDVVPESFGQDRHLHRSLGYWQLTAIGFSGVIGSGWLLGAMYAARYLAEHPAPDAPSSA